MVRGSFPVTGMSQYAVRRDGVQRAGGGWLAELAGWLWDGKATHLTRQESWEKTANA